MPFLFDILNYWVQWLENPEFNFSIVANHLSAQGIFISHGVYASTYEHNCSSKYHVDNGSSIKVYPDLICVWDKGGLVVC